MVRTIAVDDAALDIPEGLAGRGHGRGQAPHGNLPPLLHRAQLSALSSY
jgi:hypothetical protein